MTKANPKATPKARRSSEARKSAATSPNLDADNIAALVQAVRPVISAAAKHLRARERFGRAVDANDDVAAKQDGRIISDADKAEWNDAELAEARALRQLVRTKPTTVEGLRALIAYSLRSFRDQGWDEATLLQLLQSIMDSVPLRLGAKAAA